MLYYQIAQDYGLKQKASIFKVLKMYTNYCKEARIEQLLETKVSQELKS